MTVVRPNSIAGINSITVQTGQALNIHDASVNLIRSLTNSSGISTFASINVTQGISTAKSVGINTVGVAVTALMGGVKGASSGIGASMQGLYIGNGMMINDNQLNGNHYIGTAFGGIMAGPVTVNGVVTVDGNWAVV